MLDSQNVSNVRQQKDDISSEPLCLHRGWAQSVLLIFFHASENSSVLHQKWAQFIYFFPRVSENRFRILSELLLAVTKPLLYWKVDLNISCINPPNQRIAHTRPRLAWRFLLPTVVLFLELASRMLEKSKENQLF